LFLDHANIFNNLETQKCGGKTGDLHHSVKRITFAKSACIKKLQVLAMGVTGFPSP